MFLLLSSSVLSYEVFVVTGDKRNAGTSSDVKINLFGECGDSGERPLLRSMTNKDPFERKQVTTHLRKFNYFFMIFSFLFMIIFVSNCSGEMRKDLKNCDV